ncbi:ABC transporter ATP-binding protein [Janthinobacterium sp. 17J80-10]|uniref:ABC transporter ATP-binding protein n=1 Tax=Janthinobacterium sp. 17J80-10 TaxID=2497863 RepID=UPI0010058A49|nr:ABC transporter ATP-binding protein [Janthinobacterium sp. 17J80-10]QAU35532.1 ABC transporter ATP-binding protein [Janthinobacterium sp. 17J80-10]
MIVIDKLNKAYHTSHGPRTVLHDINLRLDKGDKLGILGRNGAGKSTLIRLISGIEQPTSGHVHRGFSISWPLAFGGAFQGSLTGMDNLRFICRVYDTDIAAATDYVQDFSELGSYLNEPVKTYSFGMRARLAFALSMAIEFDCYLIDEVLAVGDTRFQEKCHYELFEKRQDRSIILVSHMPQQIQAYCNTYSVLDEGHLHHFENSDEAYAFYDSKQ